jgi:hypothetical protein
MKQGKVGWGYMISGLIILIVVFAVLAGMLPMFEDLRTQLGFDVGLNPAEIESQEMAKEEFNENFVSALSSCTGSGKVKCFCLEPGSFALPTDYSIDFSPEQGDIKLSINNHKGGKVIEKWISDVSPCVSTGDHSLVSLSGEAKDSTIKVVYSSANKMIYTNLNGEDISERVDNDYYIYKPNKDSLCILREQAARLKSKDLCN